MIRRKLAIFGSTGSIGTQALDILRQKGELFQIEILSANNNFRKLAEQANEFRPRSIVLANRKHEQNFLSLLTYKPVSVHFGPESLEEVAASAEYEVLLNSLVGFAGFMSTYHALHRGKQVALANKESLVVGGDILSKMPAFKEGKLIPVDSEHSAMLQCLAGEQRTDIRKIVITASGGPFRRYTEQQMRAVTVEDALEHPNWDMGAKITVDSSTMMNKGLEIIEAKWLFSISVDRIVPVVHPQSIIHSIIEFRDGSSKAQLGPPDMKVPILYSLTYPYRLPFPNPTLDYTQPMNLEFYPVDFKKFPCLKLAIDAGKEGGVAPVVLNAANEVAVEKFLKKEIRYIDIPDIIESSLNVIQPRRELSLSLLQDTDRETRDYALTL